MRRRKKYPLRIFLLTLLIVVAAGTFVLMIMSNIRRQDSKDKITTSLQDEISKETMRDDAGSTQAFTDVEMSEKSYTGNAFPQYKSKASITESSNRFSDILADPDRMEKEKIQAITTSAPGEIVMDFTGDILFDPGYAIMSSMNAKGGGLNSGFTPAVVDELKSADLAIMNNEFPYSKRGTPIPGKTFTFRARPESAAYLKELGIDAVSIANNHAFDYGEEAFLDTMETLRGAGIKYVGGGKDIEEASSEIVYIAGERRIALVAATQIERTDNPETRAAGADTPGVFRCWNPAKLIEKVKELDGENDTVIVFIHWGTENVQMADWAQLQQAEKLVDAGADIIIGAHPHCLQPIEYVKGVPVIYSLGNFLFNSKSLDTAILQLRIPTDDRYAEPVIRFIPARQENCMVRILEGAEKTRVIDYMNSISVTAKLDENGVLK